MQIYIGWPLVTFILGFVSKIIIDKVDEWFRDEEEFFRSDVKFVDGKLVWVATDGWIHLKREDMLELADQMREFIYHERN